MRSIAITITVAIANDALTWHIPLNRAGHRRDAEAPLGTAAVTAAVTVAVTVAVAYHWTFVDIFEVAELTYIYEQIFGDVVNR